MEKIRVSFKRSQEERTPFKTWLLAQHERDDAVGDLARDAKQDRRFPSRAPDAMRHLETMGACHQAIEALRKAAHEWIRDCPASTLCADEFMMMPDEYFGPRHEDDVWRPTRDVLRPRDRFKILKRDGYRCQICGASSDEGARLEVDHKEPVSAGGGNDPENLWTLCKECNQGKSTDSL